MMQKSSNVKPEDNEQTIDVPPLDSENQNLDTTQRFRYRWVFFGAIFCVLILAAVLVPVFLLLR